jgi:hypothetical protein
MNISIREDFIFNVKSYVMLNLFLLMRFLHCNDVISLISKQDKFTVTELKVWKLSAQKHNRRLAHNV